MKFDIVTNNQGANVSIMCGWEPATSQIRVCLVLCALYATYLAYDAAWTENRKMVDNYLQSVGFLTFLLITTAAFDLLSIMDAQNDNYTTCNLEHGHKLAQWMPTGNNPCSFLWFYILAGSCLLSACVVYSSQNVMT